MRKLVTIRKMGKIYSIKGADFIVQGMIDGWSVIIKKDEIKEGELCVFFEIDSFIPKSPTFEFLGKTTTHQNIEGYRIRTLKLRKTLSQGLALPLSMFDLPSNIKEGDDVTDLLGVIKYDIDLVQNGSKIPGSGNPQGKFPSFIPKTDQERLQNLPHYFELYKDTWFEETLKLDGSSMTCYKKEIKLSWYKQLWNNLVPLNKRFDNTHFGVCSRNLEIKKPSKEDNQSNFWNAAIKYNIDKDLPVGYAVQGELLATNIQGNYEKVKDVEFYIFNVYDIEEQKYLEPEYADALVNLHLPKAKYIPIVNTEVQIFKECTTFEDFEKRVTGPSMNKEQPISEGRVYKSLDGKVSFKMISPKYLLQKNK